MNKVKTMLVLAMLALVGGCAVVPVGPGYYGPPRAAYYGPTVGVYGGWHDGRGYR